MLYQYGSRYTTKRIACMYEIRHLACKLENYNTLAWNLEVDKWRKSCKCMSHSMEKGKNIFNMYSKQPK